MSVFIPLWLLICIPSEAYCILLGWFLNTYFWTEDRSGGWALTQTLKYWKKNLEFCRKWGWALNYVRALTQHKMVIWAVWLITWNHHYQWPWPWHAFHIDFLPRVPGRDVIFGGKHTKGWWWPGCRQRINGLQY